MLSRVVLALSLLTPILLAQTSNSSFVFAVIADPQIGMVEIERDRARFAQVAATVNALKGESRPAFVILAGDYVHRAGDPKELAAFEAVKQTFQIPVHLVPGNHDVPSGGKFAGMDRFAFEYAGTQFVGINGTLWTSSDDAAEEQFAWLSRALRTRKPSSQVFVVQHQPLYLHSPGEKDGYHNTPLAWRGKLLGLFEETKVTALLSGHLHRNTSGMYRTVALLTTPSPCKNFDASPPGFRLVQVMPDGFMETYVGVEQK